MHESKQPIVMITGLPRSGTTWLVNSMNLHPKILAFGETHFFTSRWVKPTQDGRYTPEQLEALWNKLSECPFWSSVPLQDDPTRLPSTGWFAKTTRDDIPEVIESARKLAGPEPGPAEVLDAVGRAFCEREGKLFWVEKTAVEGKYAPSIVKKMPGIQMVLTMREPVGFLRSYKYQGVQHGSSRSLHEARYHPFLAALVWKLTYRSIRKVQSRYPEQVSVCILSDESNRRDALQQICRHLGVEPDDAMYGLLDTKVNSSRISSQERPLESGEIAWLRLLCTSDVPELQISEDVPKTSIPDLLKSILSLVPWMTRFLLHKFR